MTQALTVIPEAGLPPVEPVTRGCPGMSRGVWTTSTRWGRDRGMWALTGKIPRRPRGPHVEATAYQPFRAGGGPGAYNHAVFSRSGSIVRWWCARRRATARLNRRGVGPILGIDRRGMRAEALARQKKSNQRK